LFTLLPTASFEWGPHIGDYKHYIGAHRRRVTEFLCCPPLLLLSACGVRERRVEGALATVMHGAGTHLLE